MMSVNLVEIEAMSGFRTFELYQGDITLLDFKVDLSAISAFANDYSPVERKAGRP